MLIEKYDLEVTTPPCEPGAERFSAIARLVTDIREVLPYLNATLRGAIYNPAAPTITWTKADHYVAFHPYQIAVSNVEDRDAAIREVEGLVRLVNRTWERRADIKHMITIVETTGGAAFCQVGSAAAREEFSRGGVWHGLRDCSAVHRRQGHRLRRGLSGGLHPPGQARARLSGGGATLHQPR
jgi:hypothetical protein